MLAWYLFGYTQCVEYDFTNFHVHKLIFSQFLFILVYFLSIYIDSSYSSQLSLLQFLIIPILYQSVIFLLKAHYCLFSRFIIKRIGTQYKLYQHLSKMSFTSQSFIKQQHVDRSFFSQNGKRQPWLYSNSSTKIDQGQFEVQMMKEKYEKQYKKFSKAHHQRSKSQIQKIQRIIRDANDLNEILNDHDKWLRKQQKGESQQKDTKTKQIKKEEYQSSKVKWKNQKKMNLEMN